MVSASGSGCHASNGVSAGALAITTCALVPPNPNEETPQRSVPAAFSTTGSAAGARFSLSKSMYELRVAKCSVAGSTRCSIAISAFNMPATPDAGSRWPMFDLTEPIGSGLARPRPSTSPIAVASIGSPTAVPVPCASTKSRSVSAKSVLR